MNIEQHKQAKAIGFSNCRQIIGLGKAEGAQLVPRDNIIFIAK